MRNDKNFNHSVTDDDHRVISFFGDVGKSGVIALGIVGIGASLMTLFPHFFAGNFFTAAVLLLLTALCLNQRDLKGAFIELPFVILPLVIIYLQYPFDFVLALIRK